jgi:hypothetical protein
MLSHRGCVKKDVLTTNKNSDKKLLIGCYIRLKDLIFNQQLQTQLFGIIYQSQYAAETKADAITLLLII